MKVIGNGSMGLVFSEVSLSELEKVVELITAEGNYINGNRVLDFEKYTLPLEIPKKQGGKIETEFLLKTNFYNRKGEELKIASEMMLKVLALAK